MDEARTDPGDDVKFQEAEALKSVLRRYFLDMLDMGIALNVITIEEVNACTAVEHFEKIRVRVFTAFNKSLRELKDLYSEKSQWQDRIIALLDEKSAWLDKEKCLVTMQRELMDRVDSLTFQINLLKSEKQKQKELGHAREQKLVAEKTQLNNQLKGARRTMKTLRAQVEALQHNTRTQPETSSGAQQVSELELNIESRDTALEKAQKLIQRLQNENHELAENVDKSKTDKRALKAMTAERDEAKGQCEKLNIKLHAARVIEEELRAKVAEHREQLKQCATEKRKALHRSAEANRALEAQLKTTRKDASKMTAKLEKWRASEDNLREESRMLNGCNIALQANARRREDDMRALQQSNAQLYARIGELLYACHGKQRTIELLTSRVNELLKVAPQRPMTASARVNAEPQEACNEQATSMKDLAAAIRNGSLLASPCLP